MKPKRPQNQNVGMGYTQNTFAKNSVHLMDIRVFFLNWNLI